MAIIGSVTDDFTGAASAGVLMAKAQVSTGLFYDISMLEKVDADALEAIYVSSNSRAMKAEQAYETNY